MNKFDQIFFKRYIPEWQKLQWIVHEHFLVIVWQILKWLIFWVILVSFLLYYFEFLLKNIPFIIFEIYILIVYLKILYDIFNRYNDVWILTDYWIIDLDWELFWSDAVTVKYTSIEWLEVVQNWIIDTIFWKWNLVVHKIWSDKFILENANNPYLAIDEIEKYTQQFGKSEEIEEINELSNFDIIMEALSWVVWEYLEKKWNQNKPDEEKELLIEEYKDKKWTIDLS